MPELTGCFLWDLDSQLLVFYLFFFFLEDCLVSGVFCMHLYGVLIRFRVEGIGYVSIIEHSAIGYRACFG